MSGHPVEALQELLDDRLAAADRAALEGHLTTCERCRRELELLRWTRQALRGAAEEPLPEATRLDVLAALDREDTAQTPRQRVGRPWLLAAAGLAASLLLAVGLFWPRVAPPELPLAVARDFVEYRRGALTLELVTEDVAAIQDFFTDRGLGFDARVFDLAMMGYHPVGGRIHSRGAGRSALFVYAREDGRPVICQMLPGDVRELPSGATRREHDGIEFFVYEREGVTVVFWQEGSVICVLASDIPGEELVQLAFAKAMKGAATVGSGEAGEGLAERARL